jgi:tRNA-dihydrouridine synthase B
MRGRVARNNEAMAADRESAPRSLTDSWTLGSLRVPNRVLLAPLAGIGNWFVRLQAKRYGAGMAVSEMVSSHAIHHENARTCGEMLRIDERERVRGPVSIQLFGEDPEVMRSAARHVARAGADAIDINMGCPVRKVRKTGAGVALLGEPDRAVALARAAVQGAGEVSSLPVTVKLRSGRRAGDRSGLLLARRLVDEAGVAAIAFHPRPADAQHKGSPDYELAAELAGSLPAPLILTGGLRDAAAVRSAFVATGAEAVMLARGSLGNPWLFSQLLDGREAPPTAQEVLAELRWLGARAAEHLGEERASRYLRKFYPWYVARLELSSRAAKRLCESLQTVAGTGQALALLEDALAMPALAA